MRALATFAMGATLSLGLANAEPADTGPMGEPRAVRDVLDAVRDRIAAASGMAFQIRLDDCDSFSARVAGVDEIRICRRVLKEAETVDEIAFVAAHELGHLSREHLAAEGDLRSRLRGGLAFRRSVEEASTQVTGAVVAITYFLSQLQYPDIDFATDVGSAAAYAYALNQMPEDSRAAIEWQDNRSVISYSRLLQKGSVVLVGSLSAGVTMGAGFGLGASSERFAVESAEQRYGQVRAAQELEADRFALRILRQAGYRADAADAILRKLCAECAPGSLAGTLNEARLTQALRIMTPYAAREHAQALELPWVSSAEHYGEVREWFATLELADLALLFAREAWHRRSVSEDGQIAVDPGWCRSAQRIAAYTLDRFRDVPMQRRQGAVLAMCDPQRFSEIGLYGVMPPDPDYLSDIALAGAFFGRPNATTVAITNANATDAATLVYFTQLSDLTGYSGAGSRLLEQCQYAFRQEEPEVATMVCYRPYRAARRISHEFLLAPEDERREAVRRASPLLEYMTRDTAPASAPTDLIADYVSQASYLDEALVAKALFAGEEPPGSVESSVLEPQGTPPAAPLPAANGTERPS